MTFIIFIISLAISLFAISNLFTTTSSFNTTFYSVFSLRIFICYFLHDLPYLFKIIRAFHHWRFLIFSNLINHFSYLQVSKVFIFAAWYSAFFSVQKTNNNLKFWMCCSLIWALHIGFYYRLKNQCLLQLTLKVLLLAHTIKYFVFPNNFNKTGSLQKQISSLHRILNR